MVAEPFDQLQDARAEHWCETGELLSLTEYIRTFNVFESCAGPAPATHQAPPAGAPLDTRGPLLPTTGGAAGAHKDQE